MHTHYVGAALTACSQTLTYGWHYARIEADRVARGRPVKMGSYVRRLVKLPLFGVGIFHVRTAPRILIRREDAGFCANLLQVLDVIVHCRPDAALFVDWSCVGTEQHFKYGDVGVNLWDQIFEPLNTREEFEAAGGRVCAVGMRLNPQLISGGRDLLSISPNLPAVRHRYHRAYRERIRIRHAGVLQELAAYRVKMRGRPCIGVHKRVATRVVRNNQRFRHMPTNEQVAETVGRLADRCTSGRPLIYLATDDLGCVAAFTDRFGEDLLLRPDVQRVDGLTELEVHFQEFDKVTLQDACDVLIDALLLADCDEVLHLSSNVSTFVAFANPATKLTHYHEIEAHA